MDCVIGRVPRARFGRAPHAHAHASNEASKHAPHTHAPRVPAPCIELVLAVLLRQQRKDALQRRHRLQLLGLPLPLLHAPLRPPATQSERPSPGSPRRRRGGALPVRPVPVVGLGRDEVPGDVAPEFGVAGNDGGEFVDEREQVAVRRRVGAGVVEADGLPWVGGCGWNDEPNVRRRSIEESRGP